MPWSPARHRLSDRRQRVGRLDLGEVAELADVDAEDRHPGGGDEVDGAQHRAVAAEATTRSRPSSASAASATARSGTTDDGGVVGGQAHGVALGPSQPRRSTRPPRRPRPARGARAARPCSSGPLTAPPPGRRSAAVVADATGRRGGRRARRRGRGTRRCRRRPAAARPWPHDGRSGPSKAALTLDERPAPAPRGRG